MANGIPCSAKLTVEFSNLSKFGLTFGRSWQHVATVWQISSNLADGQDFVDKIVGFFQFGAIQKSVKSTKNCRSRKHSSEGNGAKWILLRVLAKKASIQPRTRPPKFGTVVFHIKVRISGIPTYNLVDDYIKSGHRHSIRSQSKCLTTR